MADDVLTEQEARDYLKLSAEQFAEIQAGPRPIPTLEVLPGVRRYRLVDLKRWLDDAMTGFSQTSPAEPRAAASLAASTGEAPADLPWVGDVVREAIAPLRTYPQARQPWMRR